MKNGSQTDTGSQEHLDHNFIVMLAINLYLPRYTTAWDNTATRRRCSRHHPSSRA
jgi:hypothetical protein